MLKANFVLNQEEISVDVLQEISCKELCMGMYIRLVLNRKAFPLFPALFISTSEVPVCKARTRTTLVDLLLSAQKIYIQSLFLLLRE